MIAIITGASRGIGQAVADKLAGLGYDLCLNAKNAVRLQQTTDELRKKYPAVNIYCKPADISIRDEAIAFGKWCLGFGVPDMLINNAGSYEPGNLIDEPDDQMEKMMNLNFYSAYHLTRTVIDDMIKKGSGSIFNMCSIASLASYPGGGSYSVSKYALHGFTKNIRYELKKHGIKVTGIFSGAAYTDTWGDFDNSTNRIMEANDIAELIAGTLKLSNQAVTEEIVIRPQLGDL